MKIYKLPSLVCLCFFYCNSLQAQQEKVDTAAFSKIRAAEMESSQVPLIAHYLTDIAGSRLTNSPGFTRAGKWAVRALTKWGLQNAKFEPWGNYGRGWEIEDFNIMLKIPYQSYIVGYPLPWSANTEGTLKAPVMRVLLKNVLDSSYFEKHKAAYKGKIIMMVNEDTKRLKDDKPFSYRLTDSDLANIKDSYMVPRKEIKYDMGYIAAILRTGEKLKSAGALALLRVDQGDRDGTVIVQNFNIFRRNSPPGLPEAVISSEDGAKMERLLSSGKSVQIALNIKGKFYEDDIKGYNIIAEIPGSDPKLKDEIVMLGAHLDSWDAATGATDNAAGCTVMMEAVRLLDSLHLKPKRTIRIALWSGEEQGTLGSYNYVKNHFGNAETKVIKPEQAKVSVYFNLDNGSGKIRGIYSQDNPGAKSIFEEWFKPFHDLGASKVTIHSTGSTDHLSFDWIGIPGFSFIQDPLDYESRTHHTNMDTFDNLQIDDLKQAAIIVASFIYQASIRPDLLPRKKMTFEKFVNDGL